MIDDMGIFRTTISIAALTEPATRREFHDVMVDTGSEYNWIPAEALAEMGIVPVRVDRFETADGRVLERDVGFGDALRRRAVVADYRRLCHRERPGPPRGIRPRGSQPSRRPRAQRARAGGPCSRGGRTPGVLSVPSIAAMSCGCMTSGAGAMRSA